MDKIINQSETGSKITRRDFIKTVATGSTAIVSGYFFSQLVKSKEKETSTFISAVSSYDDDLRDVILRGISELRVTPELIRGKRVLLKPNLVEPSPHAPHINTHPNVIRAAADAFRSLGAANVVVAEGAGHRRDSLMVLEDSGLADVLYEDKIPFIDLNNSDVVRVKNKGGESMLKELFLPRDILEADIIVSMAKMKTHHWVGATLSMKNLFGIMPGSVYGWPKNVLHWAGINQTIFDINATVRTHLSIIDGIIGMEGDGPIMGEPINSNVIVLGRDPAAVDATSARVMGLNPRRIRYLKMASGKIGTIGESKIKQIGEKINYVSNTFRLDQNIPAHKNLRL
jgi:uncharacterized protein (DUF362 family)